MTEEIRQIYELVLAYDCKIESRRVGNTVYITIHTSPRHYPYQVEYILKPNDTEKIPVNHIYG